VTPNRFEQITSHYARLRVAIVGDFCLDRYLEIDPARGETSIETGLPVHNVVNVRSQPGGAGTILNNIAALGAAEIFPVGFCGEDGEGYELQRALEARRGVRLDYFLRTPKRRTFTYCKPLVLETGRPPRELSRLDSKNWTPTPADVQEVLIDALEKLARRVDAVILLDQVDLAETGVVTKRLLERVRSLATEFPQLFAIADGRRSLRGYPPVCLKMNSAELDAMLCSDTSAWRQSASSRPEKSQPEGVAACGDVAAALAREHGRPVFVTLSERGIVGATPAGDVAHVPCLPIRGEIDIVGAGDAVTANLTAALASGATLREALELSMAAASTVIHQLGTTGTATIADLHSALA